jgi:type IV pilus assembly protein PilV
MKPCRLPTRAPRRGGFALIEALVAAALFAIGILALLGMQSMAIKRTTDARDRSAATMLSSQVLGELWTLGRGADLSVYTGTFDAATPGLRGWGTQAARSLPQGSLAVDLRGDQVTVTVRWTQPGNETHVQSQSAWIHSDADA